MAAAPAAARVELRVLGPEDAGLVRAAGDVFDALPEAGLTATFLADPRHHLVGATAGGRLVGFASGVDCVHPDKRPSLFILEVGVADDWLRRGVGLAVTRGIVAHARAIGCREAWLLTEADNAPARALYRKAGAVESGKDPVMYSFPLEAAP